MAGLSRADEVVVGESEAIPLGSKFGGNLVGKVLRRAASQPGGALDFLPVLVGAGQEPGIYAQGSLAASDCVAHDGRIRMAQVRTRIHVVNGRGEVKPG